MHLATYLLIAFGNLLTDTALGNFLNDIALDNLLPET